MALLFMDSFDHYATADQIEKWATAAATGTGTTVAIAAVGRHSSNGFRWSTGTSTNATGSCTKAVNPGDTTAVLGFALNVAPGAVGPAAVGLAQLRDGSAAQVTLRLNQDLTLSVLRGAHSTTPTVLGTSSGAITAGAFAYIEWKTTIHNTAGTTEVRINGVPALSLSSVDTQDTAATQWNTLVLGNITGISSGVVSTKTFDFDDLYVLDGTGSAPWNTFLGDCRVDARLPTAPGATTGWTPLAGANWAAVDDAAPDDDTTYNSTSTVNAVDTFVVQDAPVVGAVLYGVQHCLNLKKMDAGACTVAPVVRHAGVDQVSTAISPSTAYAYGLAINQTNPGTSAQWTEADFNAAEFGYKRTA